MLVKSGLDVVIAIFMFSFGMFCGKASVTAYGIVIAWNCVHLTAITKRLQLYAITETFASCNQSPHHTLLATAILLHCVNS